MDSEDRAPLYWNILGAFFFASMGAVAHQTAARCDWRLVVLVRSLLSLALAALLARRAGAALTRDLPAALWVRSLTGAAAQLMTFFALASLPASDVITIRNTSPIWIALLARPLFGERSGPGLWVAVVLGVAGVFLVEQPRLVALDPPTLLAVVASFLVAAAMLSLSRCGDVDQNVVVAHFSAVTLVVTVGLLAAPLGVLDLGALREPTVWVGLVGVGLLGCGAQLAMTRAYGRGKPVSLSVVGLSQVVFAFGLDLAAGVRGLAPMEGLGTAMILAPTAWLSRPKRRVMD